MKLNSYLAHVFLIATFLLLSLLNIPGSRAENPLDCVDPLIGTSNTGNTYPAVCMPFGMIKWTPQTRAGERKGIPPYIFEDTAIQGFRGTHFFSGSAVPEYGSVAIMPLSGELKVDPIARGSKFSHSNEKSTPYYYAVTLDDYAIKAEITATTRVGYFRFIFPESNSAYILVQPNNNPYADHTRNSVAYVRVIPEKNEVVGFNPCFRFYAGTGKPAGFMGYFAARFSKPFSACGVWRGNEIKFGTLESFGQPGAFLKFSTKEGETIKVKIGISFTGIDEARKNLEGEIPEWNFSTVMNKTKETWQEELNKIEVEGGTKDQRVSFYTSLYHSLLLPKIVSDVDGSYPGFADDAQIHKATKYPYYDDFSIWDTFRAEHPLLLLVEPAKSMEMIESLLLKTEQGGWLPIFPAWNSYTSEMVGDHVISVITDGYTKGFRNFDIERIYKIMKKNATETPKDYAEYADGKGRRALESYTKYGYIPLEDPVAESFHNKEQTSRTLEYAYDDFCLAEFAKAMGEMDDYELFRKRAYNYKNVFDPSVGFVRGRHADGSWRTPFDPTSDKLNMDITEGTPWHYTWYVPHDVQGLIDLMDGREKFIAKLDTLFEKNYYWHGNEPSHQISYLYNYAGAPWKTQAQVRTIMEREYNIGPGGLSGNDDAGQMSAWYIFSAMGFYPVCPGIPAYEIGSPVFDKVIIHLDKPFYGGDSFIIMAEYVSKENKYIQSATLNGQPLNKPWFEHAAIKNGGALIFKMGAKPNKNWGSKPEDAPPSMTKIR